MDDVFKKYHKWIEKTLSKKLPEGINGFAINLYENTSSFDAELIATPEFDPDDEDWACDDIFMSKKFKFPHKALGSDWEPALEEIANSTKNYISLGSKGACLLTAVKGVGVGFVDGNLVLVHINA